MNNKGSLLPTLLTVLFVGLKLGGVITWSWWLVLSPIWISVIIAVFLVALGVYLSSQLDKKKKRIENKFQKKMRELLEESKNKIHEK